MFTFSNNLSNVILGNSTVTQLVLFEMSHSSNLQISKSPVVSLPWLQDYDKYISRSSHTGFFASDWRRELSPSHGIAMKVAAEYTPALNLLLLQTLNPNNNRKLGILLSEGNCILKPVNFLIFDRVRNRFIVINFPIWNCFSWKQHNLISK